MTDLDALTDLISKKEFLNCEILMNEVPFFIWHHDPAKTDRVYETLKHLRKRLDSRGVETLEVSLYDLSIEILKSRDLWDQIIEQEKDLPKEDLLEVLQNNLDPENFLTDAILNKIDLSLHKVLFITGVGEVYPYIRSHAVLTNLQKHLQTVPTILLFPGSYSANLDLGASLKLFNLLPDDRYYRAGNLLAQLPHSLEPTL